MEKYAKVCAKTCIFSFCIIIIIIIIIIKEYIGMAKHSLLYGRHSNKFTVININFVNNNLRSVQSEKNEHIIQ